MADSSSAPALSTGHTSFPLHVVCPLSPAPLAILLSSFLPPCLLLPRSSLLLDLLPILLFTFPSSAGFSCDRFVVDFLALRSLLSLPCRATAAFLVVLCFVLVSLSISADRRRPSLILLIPLCFSYRCGGFPGLGIELFSFVVFEAVTTFI